MAPPQKKTAIKKGGKKKFVSVEEKKAKGLKLNQVERKKMRKKAATAPEPKVELTEAEERLFSRPTLAEAETVEVVGKAKRVSFSKKLEHTKEFAKTDVVAARPSKTSPGKSILSRAAAGKTEPKKEEPEDAAPVEKRRIVAKRKKPIQVTRKVKEQLMEMDRKQRKAFLLQLKANKKPEVPLMQESKQFWEKIRSSKTSEAERTKLLTKLVETIRGKIPALAFNHATSRVIQAILKSGSKDLRDAVFEELNPELLRLMKSKFGKHIYVKLLRMADESKRRIMFDALNGHCVRLLKNTDGAVCLESIFNDFASAEQRFRIASEFYGNDFMFFRDQVTERNIADIFEKHPTKKNPGQHPRGTGRAHRQYTLTHRLLLEYISHCTNEDRATLIASVADRVAEIVHTPDGSAVGMRCVWNGTVKDRKMIVKNFKGLVASACKEQYAHRVLLAIFDSVDDTVLVNKYILSEIGASIGEVCDNKFGQKVLNYLVSPRDPDYFLKSVINMLALGDGNAHTKKPSAERYKELFAGIVEPLLNHLAENMDSLLLNELTVDLVRRTLRAPQKDDLFQREIPNPLRAACYFAIEKVVGEEFIPMNRHAVEDLFSHLALVQILRSDPHFDIKLGDYFADLPAEQLQSFIGCQKGCFVLVAMMEHGTEKAKDAVRAAVKPSFLKKYANKGAKVLLKKLEAK
ncbi:hypothetical protein QR680_006418 [Steinernema hermaphroditum]|uniref:PUM-HD domain-containing protein n=1 Tax=Steinernema hermaphroditum TaxID=289476 RepID=A0AA39LWI3_9BILA|nr:hypothetical protein QR680_006418 [Steinernema hermaphroditum]